MKKKFLLLAVSALTMMAAACQRPTPDPGPEPGPGPEPVVTLYDISVQLVSDGANLTVGGISVALVDDSGMTTYDGTTNLDGAATFKVPAGTYTASATYKTAEDGQRIAYNGSNTNIGVAEGATTFKIDLNKVVSQQIIIKELYSTGCPNSAAGADKSYSNDAYVILYNNSDLAADASDIIFGFVAPYLSSGSNKYIVDGKLLFENEDWIPSYGGLIWFKNPVEIPPYSQIVIAIFGGIDHTQTVAESVDLSDPSYYWMSTEDIPAWTHDKYSISETIPAEHYLSGAAFTKGSAWSLSNASPAFFIGKMDSARAKALCEDADGYDHTMGTSEAMNVVKFPKANVVDALDIWGAANLEKSNARFSSDINTGHVVITNKLGYTAYRNVDKEATEALEENAGKLVYDYAGGTQDEANGSTDPSGIDAEASIANGAHIIYSDTNDSGKDFHQRRVASIKK